MEATATQSKLASDKYRSEAHECAKRMQFTEAARLFRLAIEVYPARERGHAMGVIDIQSLEVYAKGCEVMGEE